MQNYENYGNYVYPFLRAGNYNVLHAYKKPPAVSN
jgi:hypothetical protein